VFRWPRPKDGREGVVTSPRLDHHRRDRVRPAGCYRRPTAVPARRRRLRTPQPRDQLPLALRPTGPVPTGTHHRGQPARPAPAPRPRRRHRRRVLPQAPSPSEGSNPDHQQLNNPRAEGFTGPLAGTNWPLTPTRRMALSPSGATPAVAGDETHPTSPGGCPGRGRPRYSRNLRDGTQSPARIGVACARAIFQPSSTRRTT
jgi:hypothetical protein